MRLVKALRRRIVVARACALAVSVGAMPVGCVEGCLDDGDDDDTSAGEELTAADCAPTLRMPMSPRVMEVLDDGSVHPGPPCASANCLAGDLGAWGFRDATSTKIEVGAQRIELPPPPEGSVPSRFAAQHALRGFVLGRHLAVIDRGAELDVVTPEGTRRVPTPPLRDTELVHKAWRDDDQLFLWVRAARRGAQGRVVPLQAERLTAPRDDATVIDDADHAHVGWLLPARDGARARIQRSDGVVVPLAFDVPAQEPSNAQLLAGRFVVRVGKRIFVVAAEGTPGALIVELPAGFEVASHESTLYAINARAPGGFHVVGAHGLEPLLVPRPGHDLAGAPLPEGASVQRVEIAVHDTRALVAERVRLATCTVEDRLVLVDLRARSARTIASGDVVRLHPTLAGDRFRYVEADASYETR